jgi:hypothetical protein
MAPTPLRNVRVADDLWNAAREKTSKRWHDDRLTLTDVITKALQAYVTGETQYLHPCGKTPEWHVQACRDHYALRDLDSGHACIISS